MTNARAVLLPLFLLASASAHAGIWPISISIFPPAQFPAHDDSVAGARMSLLWGKHAGVYGLDLGVLGNITSKNFVGTALAGLFNVTDDATVVGTQMTFGANITRGKATVLGAQIAGILNYNANATVVGLQLGLINVASRVVGVQVGLFNKTKNLHGVQIGLVNLHTDGFLPFFPVINVGL